MDKRMSMDLGGSWSEMKWNSKIKLQKGFWKWLELYVIYVFVFALVHILRVLLIMNMKVLIVLFRLTSASAIKGWI